MPKRTPTVTIQTKNGPVIIDEDQYDKDTMKLATDAQIAKAEKEAEAANPVEAEKPTLKLSEVLVDKEGRKFYAIGLDGQKITDVDGIDAGGYATEEGAWEAIRAVASA